MRSIIPLDISRLMKIGLPVLPDMAEVVPDRVEVYFKSECHNFKGAWVPEPDSAAAALKAGKHHWNGSSCLYVRGRLSYLYRGRTHDGQEFDRLPNEERCGPCNIQFQMA